MAKAGSDEDAGAQRLAQAAAGASRLLAGLSGALRNRVLREWAQALAKAAPAVERANARDCRAAAAANLPAALIDRLRMDRGRLGKVAQGLRAVAALPDPLGREIWHTVRPNGLDIRRVRVPIGTILIVYEARPNVTVEAAALCFKSGNACILRGGKEARHTNRALCEVLAGVLRRHKVPPAAVSFVTRQERGFVGALLKQTASIDLVIPRGGESLIRAVSEASRIPVIKHYKGVCHVYVDRSADLAMARRIVINAKTQRPGVCNAAECLLVHQAVAAKFLPALMKELQAKECEVRADPRARRLMPGARAAVADDFGREFLDLILAVRVVDSLDSALGHIARWGSKHTDAIVARDAGSIARFKREVDTACVHVNASTRFNDGFEYGLGAEIGISTDKLHARGPMGLEELTTYKYVVTGHGQVRE
ncbi:MAG: glutamate-5-semialdehyde dehydrogenase [Planctomycetota bacterium]